MKTHKIVKVEWIDSTGYKGWRDRDVAKDYEPAQCTSCGILVKTKKGSIGVTHSIDGKLNEIDDTMVIPRKAIRKIEVLGKFKA